MIGSKIKKMRELRNLTQEYVAEKLDISQQAYSKIEADETDVSFKRLEQICKTLNVNIKDLIDFDEKMVFNIATQQTQQNGVFIKKNEGNEVTNQERKLYELHITKLNDEILHLRGVLEKVLSK